MSHELSPEYKARIAALFQQLPPETVEALTDELEHALLTVLVERLIARQSLLPDRSTAASEPDNAD